MFIVSKPVGMVTLPRDSEGRRKKFRVLTDTAEHAQWRPALGFALRGVGWGLVLFGALRLSLIETHVLLPLTLGQARLADAIFGSAPHPVAVTLACSGAEALALCAGAILAFPATWVARVTGVFGGAALILAFNTVRIATLGRAAGSPPWFDALHVYVWPALITLAVAAYVFIWMQRAGGRALLPVEGTSANALTTARNGRLARRTQGFLWGGAGLLAVFSVAAPMYGDSAGVVAATEFIARAAAGVLGMVGVRAGASANVLWTAQGGFLVTHECILTPLIPVYVAAVAAYVRRWPLALVGVAAAVPLFIALGVARLLVVALPPTLVAAPLFFVHAFYQLVAAGVIVASAARWCRGGGRLWPRRAVFACVAGVVSLYLCAPVYAQAVSAAVGTGLHLDDPQGAITFLPVFQVGLYVALSVAALPALGWRRFLPGLLLLGLSQVTVFALLHVASRYGSVTPHVRDVRAWALAAPILVVAAMVMHARSRR